LADVNARYWPGHTTHAEIIRDLARLLVFPVGQIACRGKRLRSTSSQQNRDKAALPGDFDDLLFAVWSQQWPRLRRNFRFQTAATREPRSPGGAMFDVTVMLLGSGVRPAPTRKLVTPWLQVAASDELGRTSGEMRRLLCPLRTRLFRIKCADRPPTGHEGFGRGGVGIQLVHTWCAYSS